MGLDMYILRYPKYSEDENQNNQIIEFVYWIQKGLDCSFSEWCGNCIKAEDLPDTKTLIDTIGKCPIEYGGSVKEEVAYWRKANHIHKWFVDNIQDGVDDCDKHRPLTKEDLIKLRNTCNEVLEDNSLAPKLLPTMPGFFFGSTEYDEWYYNIIERTSEVCEKLINETDFDKYRLYYGSSW